MPHSIPPTWQVNLGQQIRQARLDKRYPQKKLAAVLNLRREMIRLYERGKNPPPLPALRRIADELGTTFSVDGITVPAPSPTTPRPTVLAKQASFDFRGGYKYVGATVRVSLSKKQFKVTGRLPDKAANR